MFHFGSGTIWGTQNSVNGVVTANPTPRIFGTLQDIALDLSFDIKELHGRKQFPDDIARGKAKITGKAKFANINGSILNELFFGGTNVAGQKTISLEETAAIPTTPFQITVTNSANFLVDLGVRYVTGASAGLELKRVASAPVTGQYSVAAGVYTFAAADTGLSVMISYTYTTAATGFTTTVVNQIMGSQPKFTMNLLDQYNGKQFNVKLFSCVAQKLALATKLEDYLVPEFDFMAHADASGNVIEISSGE